jgi:hypothetical protein
VRGLETVQRDLDHVRRVDAVRQTEAAVEAGFRRVDDRSGATHVDTGARQRQPGLIHHDVAGLLS